MSHKNDRYCPMVGLVVLAIGCGGEIGLDSSVPAAQAKSKLGTEMMDCDAMGSLIENGDFSADLSKWTTEIHVPTSATLSAVPDGTPPDKVLRARNSKVQDFYKVQLWQLIPSRIERDHCYRLCFRAKASAPRQIQVQVIRNAAPWDSYGLWYPKDISTSWTDYKTEFWATADAEDARLAFTFGSNTAATYIDDVVLKDLGDIDTCAVP